MPSQRILIVDDDLDVTRVLKESLEVEGYSVLVGYDGQMAVNLARKQTPDLIILDVTMPMTNGFKALEFLRKIPETQGIPVIFLTGVPSQEVYPHLAKHTRVAHLKKPLDIADLHSVLHELLPPAE